MTPDTAQVVLRRGNAISSDRGALGLSDLVISRDGNIASVTPHRSDRQWGDDFKVIDLDGLTVIPGLIDAHFHILATGTQLLTIDLADVKSVPEVLELLEARAGDGDSDWLIAGHLDDEHPGARLPTLTELDRAFPRRPLFIEHRSCHFALCNTKAIEQLRLPDAARANGVLEGQLVGIARQWLMEVQGEAFIEETTESGQPCRSTPGCNDSPRDGRWGPLR